MSDNVPINDADTSLAKKRLARELRICIIGQTVALFIFWAGLILYTCDFVPNYPEWDSTHSICGRLAFWGAVVFIAIAISGIYEIMIVTFLSIWIKIYGGSVWAYLPLALVGLIVSDTGALIPIFTLFFIFQCYCIIPQIFIARWLTKEVKNDTIQIVNPHEKEDEA